VDGGVKGGAFGQGVARIEKFARTKDARAAILQKDFHLTAEHEQPLRGAGAVECALKTHRALTQLVAAAGHQGRQAALWRAFGEVNTVVAKACAAIGVGEEDDFFQ